MSNYVYSDGELYHYGVLGMKWGKRRARKLTEKAQEHRRYADDLDPKNYTVKLSVKERAKLQSEKRAELAKAEKLEKKAQAVTDKHVRLAGGKKTYNYTTSQSTGKLVVKSLLMGSYGSLKYDQAKAEHKSRGQAAVAGVLYDAGNYATVGLLGVIEPRASKKKRK